MKIGDKVKVKSGIVYWLDKIGTYKAIVTCCGRKEYIVQFPTEWSYFHRGDIEVFSWESVETKKK